MPKPSWDEIRSRIAVVVAAPKNYDPIESHDNDKLRDDLSYTTQTLGALAKPVNKAFFVQGKGLTPAQIRACLKVIGISAKVDEQPIGDFK